MKCRMKCDDELIWEFGVGDSGTRGRQVWGGKIFFLKLFDTNAQGTAGHGDGMFSGGNYFSQDLDRIFIICYLYFFIIIIIIK